MLSHHQSSQCIIFVKPYISCLLCFLHYAFLVLEFFFIYLLLVHLQLLLLQLILCIKCIKSSIKCASTVIGWSSGISNKYNYVVVGDVVALVVGSRTCDLQVAGLSPGWAPLHSGLGQLLTSCLLYTSDAADE